MSDEAPVRIEVHNGIAMLLIDNPPVNATSYSVRAALMQALAQMQADEGVTAIIIACEGRTFIAGGDIREFGKPPLEPYLPDVCNAIEACSKPVVAAIHGSALGGGLEIALACHARIAAPNARIGLPEVKLGLLPGAGGTQRLPRIAGMPAAIDMISSGRQVKASEALALGLIDAIAQDDLRTEARGVARSLAGKALRRTGEMVVAPFEEAALKSLLTAIAKRARGQNSPIEAARVTQFAAILPLREGMAAERTSFLKLMSDPQSRALRHAFFAEREILRIPGFETITARPLHRIGVIGAGTMGAGIAVALADAGLSVTIVETSAAAMDAGRRRVSATLDRNLKSGRIDGREHAARLALIEFDVGFEPLAECDLVVEAVFEDMSVKKDVFERLGRIARPGAVLATNTSYLDVNEIAAASGRPRDVIGLHFFAPANIMRLTEIVRCRDSAPDAIATGLALAKRLGKIPVVCGVCDGFVGNRILSAFRQQAEFAVEDGALPHEVDAAMEAFGFPMGPFAVSDLSGLDISLARRKRLEPTRDPAARYASRIADALCAMGRLGQKTGAGWYRYEGGRRFPDAVVSELVERTSRDLGIRRAPLDAETIQMRIRAAIVNEGAKILAEGIVPRSIEIDMAMIHGYGYPAWRGGPMFEADELGLATILRDVEALERECGRGWEPAPLLIELVKTGATFSGLRN